MTHDVGMVIEQTRFDEIYPFAPRTIDRPTAGVVRTEAPTDEEIVTAIMNGIANRPCILDRDAFGVPRDGEMLLPSLPERHAIAHFLLPTVRRLVTGQDVDKFDFMCGGACGEESCQRG